MNREANKHKILEEMEQEGKGETGRKLKDKK